MFAAKLHFLQLAQAAQPHVEDRFGLAVGEAEFGHHHLLWLILRADDLDDAIEVEIGDDIAVEQFDPRCDLVEPVARAPDQHVDLMPQPFDQQGLQAQHARRVGGVEHVQIERKAVFQVGQAKQAVHQHLIVDGAGARFDDDANLRVGFVAHIGQDRQLLVVDQRRDLLDQLRLLHLIRNFGDDRDPGAAAMILLVPARARAEGASSGGIGFGDDRRAVHQHAAGRKVRPPHDLHQCRMIGIGVVYQQMGGVDQFSDIMRRNAGRHADRDAAGAIGEQIGEKAGKHLRLLILAIIGRAEIDRSFVQPRHQISRRLRQPRFGIAHGRGIIAVDISEIPLPVDQRRPQGKVLRQPHHGVIDRRVAMGVIFADHVANDTGAFLVGGGVPRRIGREYVGAGPARLHPQQPHRPEQAAMHGLQPIAQVRQRPRGDGRERIDEIALGKRFVERMVLDGVERVAKVCHSLRNSSARRFGKDGSPLPKSACVPHADLRIFFACAAP